MRATLVISAAALIAAMPSSLTAVAVVHALRAVPSLGELADATLRNGPARAGHRH